MFPKEKWKYFSVYLDVLNVGYGFELRNKLTLSKHVAERICHLLASSAEVYRFELVIIYLDGILLKLMTCFDMGNEHSIIVMP